MLSKRLLIFAFIGLFAFLLGLFSFLWLKNKNLTPIKKASEGFSTFQNIVESLAVPVVKNWDDEKAVLTYLLKGKSYEMAIVPFKPVIIIRKNAPGQPIDETLILSQGGTYWKSAFCPGDKLQFINNPDGSLKTIRNLGPRLCE